jgi:sortase A
MARRVLALVCIVLGIGIFLYPTIMDRYESYRQQQILAEWQDNLARIDQPEPESDLAIQAEAVPTSAVKQKLPQTVPATKQPSTRDNAEGVLIINKIDLKLPILTGATPQHLLTSVASIAHTGKPGEVGNYAIAGHRNRKYGKNFNRLDEVKVGDLIKVDTGKKVFTYKVDRKLYVKPTDVWILEGNRKDREITLVTCHPMINPTQRLIVKGKLVE